MTAPAVDRIHPTVLARRLYTVAGPLPSPLSPAMPRRQEAPAPAGGTQRYLSEARGTPGARVPHFPPQVRSPPAPYLSGAAPVPPWQKVRSFKFAAARHRSRPCARHSLAAPRSHRLPLAVLIGTLCFNRAT